MFESFSMRTIRLFKALLFLSLSAIAFGFYACSESEGPELSDERLITSFRFDGLDSPAPGRVVDSTGVILVTVPFGTDKTQLAPVIELSEGATIDPPSGVPQDFSDFVVYVVTSESGAQKGYTVLVSEGASNDASLKNVRLPDLFQFDAISSSQTSVDFDVPFGTDVQNVVFQAEANEPNATIDPPSGSVLDLTQPQLITVTAPDGVVVRTYNLVVNVLPQETGIRGVWLTNVDSNVLNSKEGIEEAVEIIDELNFNTIFVVTLNKALTTYPSAVMESVTGTSIDPTYAGRDPLRELIDAAHTRDIKVFAWFEYGFAANNGSPGPILDARPEWAAINRDGQQVVKNGFFWMNALHPDVQGFMTDLVLEVVQNYPDIDGVQGDDRLPAMPTEGGYDEFTRAEYAAEHNGASPPNDTKNSAWIRWRANRLNDYARDLYQQVKALNPNCMVAMSPSPMTFGLVEYLQDYPTWVNEGYCDIVSPQLYRRDNQGLGVYRSLLLQQLNLINPSRRNTFYPGILSYLGSYTPSEQFMVDMIRVNRERGVAGEVHFFYNALLVRDRVLRVLYPGKAIFPTF